MNKNRPMPQENSQYIIYLDVFFAINYCLDYILLRITRAVIKDDHRKYRILIGAFAGACYSLIVITTPLIRNSPLLLGTNVLAAGIMSRISFGYINLKKTVKQTVMLYIITFAAGGIMNVLYYSTGFGVWIREVLLHKNGSYKGISLVRFVLITLLAYVMINAIWKYISKWKREEKNLYQVSICHKGREAACTALYDTGNSLREPVTGKIVHMAEQEILKEILEGDETVREKICVIPYHSVGKEHGILYGIRVEKIVIHNAGEHNIEDSNCISSDENKNGIVLEQPVVAIYKGKLSAIGEYTMILNKDAFENK